MTTPQGPSPLSCDVLVVGGGPVGLFAVFECGMARLSCCVVDALDHLGGQCSALYPEKPIYDIPGFPEVSGQGLVDNLTQQMAPFHPQILLGQFAEKLDPPPAGGYAITTSKGQIVHTRAIIIAGGNGSFGPHRPPLDGIEAFEGTHVFYAVKDPSFFHHKKVVIAGGGDSAVDWALQLWDKVDRLTVVHRRDRFRAAPESEQRLKNLAQSGHLDLVVPYHLDHLEGDDGTLKAIGVKTFQGETKSIPADALLAFFGLKTDTSHLQQWGLEFDAQRIKIDPLTCASNVPGLYAIGDIATYPHKQKLILTGFAEAAQATAAIRRYLFPNQTFHFAYSTTSGIPTVDHDTKKTASRS